MRPYLSETPESQLRSRRFVIWLTSIAAIAIGAGSAPMPGPQTAGSTGAATTQTLAGTGCSVPSPSYCDALHGPYPHVMDYKTLTDDQTIPCYSTTSWATTDPDFRAAIQSRGLDLYSGLMVDTFHGNCGLEIVSQYHHLYPSKLLLMYQKPAEGYPSDYADSWPGYFVLIARSSIAANVDCSTANLNTATVALPTGESTKYRVGDVVVMWNGSGAANDFTGYEYASVSAKTSTSVTVERHLYHTTCQTHASGTFLAALAPGLPGTAIDPMSYLYNLSSIAPVNPDNAMRGYEWVAMHSLANIAPYPVDGVEFDVAEWFVLDTTQATPNRYFDCNNDGIADYCQQNIGQSRNSATPQTSAYGVGYAQFLSYVRNGNSSTTGPNFTGLGQNKLILADHGGRDTTSSNGAEFESFPNQRSYDQSSSAFEELQWYDQTTSGREQPRISYPFTKEVTQTYCDPNTTGVCGPAGSDSHNRYGLAASLLTGGFHPYIPAGGAGFAGNWPWDENVGQDYAAFAAGTTDPTARAAQIGYLGQPVNAMQTLADPAAGPNRVANSSFESGTTDWNLNTASSAYAATMSVASTSPSGQGLGSQSLQINVDKTSPNPDNVSATGMPSPYYNGVVLSDSATSLGTVVNGAAYTLSFWATSDATHVISIRLKAAHVGLAAPAQSLKIGAGWHQYTLNFQTGFGGTTPEALSLQFGMGRELGQYWIDGVQFHSGTSGLRIRTFDRGVVAMNDSSATLTTPLTAPAGYAYVHMKGTQDPTINTGCPVTIGLDLTSYPGCTLATGILSVGPKDGIILVAVPLPGTQTATTLTSSLSPSTLTQSITLSASVTSLASGITGSVTFHHDGATTLGSAAVDGTGKASLNTSSLSTGSHTITATYGGDATHLSSTSSTLSQVVVIATQTHIAISSNPANPATPVTVTATIAAASGGGTPTGNVTFSAGEATTTLALSSGQAVWSTSTLPIGADQVQANYDGDSLDAPSTSTTSITVNRWTSSTAVIGNVVSPGVARPLTLIATISTPTGAPAPTGSVTFSDGGTILGTASVSGGTASLATSFNVAATHAVTATYSGDSSTAPSTASLQLAVHLRSTVTTLASSLNPSVPGQSVDLTATVAAKYSGPVPTGNVCFLMGTTSLGCSSMSSGGVATLATSALPQGQDPLTAVYQCDAEYGASTSSIDVQTVN